MKYLGNFAEDAVFDTEFNTTQTDGTPITLAGSPAVSVYKDNSTTETTAGVTLSVDVDGAVGAHNVRIDTSADAFYATGSNYKVKITAGTVDGTSVVGTVVAEFSIENRYDVAASVTGSVGSISGVSFPSNFSALGISGSGHVSRVTLVDTTTTNTDMRGTDSAYTGTPPTAAAIADAVFDEAASGHVGAGTFGKLFADVLEDTNELQTNQGNWLTATGFSTHSATDVWTSGTRTLTAGTKDTEIDAIKTKTDNLPASPAAVGSEMNLANDAITAGKYDESTAFPLKSDDSGSTQVARTGADGDTLETLSDQIDGVGGGGGATNNIDVNVNSWTVDT